MLRVKCPDCGITVSIDSAINRFECGCGKLLTVPRQPGEKPRKRKPAQAWTRPVPNPAGIGAPRSASADVSGGGRKPTAQFATPKTTPAEQQPVATKQNTPEPPKPSPKNADVPPDLSTFQLRKVSDDSTLMNNEDDYPPEFVSDPTPLTHLKFLVFTFWPYIVVASLIACGVFFRGQIQRAVLQSHEKMVDAVRPQHTEFVPAVDPATDVEPATAETVDRVLRTNVRVAIEGIGTGAGVICSIVGSEALILTNRSVVDQSYSRTKGKVPTYELPDLELEYSDLTKASGEVIWVAEDGIDLAIIKASRVGPQAQAANWQGSRQVDTGDHVFFLDSEVPVATNGDETELQHAGISEVRNEERSNHDIPIVRVDSSKVLTGTGLFSKNGELIAIAGPIHATGSSDPGSAIVVSLLDQLRPEVLAETRTP